FVIRSVKAWFAGTVIVWGVKRRFSKRSSITVSSPRAPAGSRTMTRTVSLKKAIRFSIFFPFKFLKTKKEPGPAILAERWALDSRPLAAGLSNRRASTYDFANLFQFIVLPPYQPL